MGTVQLCAKYEDLNKYAKYEENIGVKTGESVTKRNSRVGRVSLAAEQKRINKLKKIPFRGDHV